VAAALGRRGRTNRNKTIKGKEWNREACASKERRTKADARSRLFPARSNPWGEFGIGRWPWGRANGQLGMEIQNTTRPHDWSCILMKGDRQGPRKVVRRTHTHTHTEAEGGGRRNGWNTLGRWKGAWKGAASIGGSAEPVGAGPLLSGSGSQSNRPAVVGTAATTGKVQSQEQPGPDAHWPIKLPLVFWLSSRKTVERATADQNPRIARARREGMQACPPATQCRTPPNFNKLPRSDAARHQICNRRVARGPPFLRVADVTNEGIRTMKKMRRGQRPRGGPGRGEGSVYL
jgi:hypothetical protein